jgi:O-antigen/teichoic acid export membrane protein
MGIIIKQSIKGSIWSYLGVAVGFVTTAYLFPNYLSTDTIGLFGLLLSWSTLLGQFSLLGIHGVTSRLFPLFRDKSTHHHGFLSVAFLFFIVGFSLFVVVYLLFSSYLVETNREHSKLFADYVYLIIPLTFFTMIFIELDTYNKVLYDSVLGIFLQDFLQRVFLFLATGLFAFKIIDLNQFILTFTFIVSFKALIIIYILFRRGEINLGFDFSFITKKLRNEIFDVALFSVITGLGGIIVFNLDKIIINQMLGLSKTGVYTIAFYFGSLVIIPSRPLLKISGTLIADSWAKNDVTKISELYNKSCITLTIIGGFLFLGIWANIDNILQILGSDYAQSKWVIFFIGLGYLFDMVTGANGQIIAFSEHYRMALVFISVLIVIVIILLILFIPVWGITGAAVSIATGLFLNNLMRYFYLYKKYMLQPFNWKFVLVLGFYVSLFFLIELIPQQQLILDIVIRGTLIIIATGLFLVFVPISEDIDNMKKNVLAKIKNKI